MQSGGFQGQPTAHSTYSCFKSCFTIISWYHFLTMLRAKIRQTGVGITIKKVFSKDSFSTKCRSKLMAISVLSFAAIILFKHFSSFRLAGGAVVEDNNYDEEEKPVWWNLSPLWAEDGRPHVNPHPFRFINNNPEICHNDDRTDILIMVNISVVVYTLDHGKPSWSWKTSWSW